MRDPMFAQPFEVFRLRPLLVAQFDSVVPALRNCAEELIQCGHEITATLQVRLMKCGELENERPDFLAMRLQRIQELPLEQFGIEEI